MSCFASTMLANKSTSRHSALKVPFNDSNERIDRRLARSGEVDDSAPRCIVREIMQVCARDPLVMS